MANSQYRKDITDATNEAAWTFSKIFFKVFLPGLLFVVIAGVVLNFAGVFSAPGKILSNTFQPENVIHNYEWFYNKYHSVKAYEGQIVEAEAALASFTEAAGERSNWTFEDKTEWSRLNSVVLGLKNQRRSAIEDYNAKSQMVNREIFKGGDLPETLTQ